MKVGITYDLRQDYLDMGYSLEETAEFDKPDTIDGIEQGIRQMGHDTERIGHVKNLVQALAAGKRWDLVFNIAEGMTGYGREAQIPCLLEAYGIPYTFSDSLVLALCLHKAVCKRVVRDAGIPTAEFAVVDCASDIGSVDLPFPLFVKPVSEGTGKGISPSSIIQDGGQLRAACEDLLTRFGQPVLVETFLPGREYTVGVLGTDARARVIGNIEVVFIKAAEVKEEVYSYLNKEHYDKMVRYDLVTGLTEVEDVALRAYRVLGCRDAGRVDIRLDRAGRPMFMEINPLAGLNPTHSDLPILNRLAGRTYPWLIAEIVNSAVARIRK